MGLFLLKFGSTHPTVVVDWKPWYLCPAYHPSVFYLSDLVELRLILPDEWLENVTNFEGSLPFFSTYIFLKKFSNGYCAVYIRVLVNLPSWIVWLDILFWWVLILSLCSLVACYFNGFLSCIVLWKANWWKWCYSGSYTYWFKQGWFFKQPINRLINWQ